MRTLNKEEIKKRGCVYCGDVKRVKETSENGSYEKYVRKCPYDECPYHELDKFETYNDYLKSLGDFKLGK